MLVLAARFVFVLLLVGSFRLTPGLSRPDVDIVPASGSSSPEPELPFPEVEAEGSPYQIGYTVRWRGGPPVARKACIPLPGGSIYNRSSFRRTYRGVLASPLPSRGLSFLSQVGAAFREIIQERFSHSELLNVSAGASWAPACRRPPWMQSLAAFGRT